MNGIVHVDSAAPGVGGYTCSYTELRPYSAPSGGKANRSPGHARLHEPGRSGLRGR